MSISELTETDEYVVDLLVDDGWSREAAQIRVATEMRQVRQRTEQLLLQGRLNAARRKSEIRAQLGVAASILFGLAAAMILAALLLPV